MPIFNSVVVAASLLLMIFAGGIGVSCYKHNGRHDQLSPSFYAESCPRASAIVRKVIKRVQEKTEPRIAASLARLHFHDCFVNGCDGSVLLDNTDKIKSEKEALPNNNSLRGFDVIDEIKAAIEKACPATVSCADILTMAAAQSVCLSGGPSWEVRLGRRDGRIANRSGADVAIPIGFDTLDVLKSKFRAVGLDRPRVFIRIIAPRLYNFSNTGVPDPTLNHKFLAKLRRVCPHNGNGTALANQDPRTPDRFDNSYYSILKANKGLLTSDQVLYLTPKADTIEIVNNFSASQASFFKSFADAMITMGNISPLTGTKGEIRLNCRRVNDN